MSNDELNKAMDEVLKYPLADRHSFFQLKYFVVGKEPTLQAKMWRCLRELETRRESIRSLDQDFAEATDQLELLNLDLSEAMAPSRIDDPDLRKDIRIRQLKRKIAKIEMAVEAAKKKKMFLQEEAEFFLKTFMALNKTEPVRPYDDPQAQMEYWNEKLRQELNMRVMLRQPFDPELVKTILAMDDNAQVKKDVVNMLTAAEKQLEAKRDNKDKQLR